MRVTNTISRYLNEVFAKSNSPAKSLRKKHISSHASNGLTIKLNSYYSTLARAGAAFGYQLNTAQNPIDLYIKTGYVKEFSGKTSYKLSQYKEKYNFRGGWVDSAVGVNAQFNKRHNVYGEISYANGDRFDKQQINLGYRYQF